MRRAFRLLPIPFSIALALPAMAADEKPVSYALCPVQDAIPAFDGAPAAVAPQDQAAQRQQSQLLPTDVTGDTLNGNNIDGTANYQGNVRLIRGDQFLNADNLFLNQDNGTYTADGNVRYQDAGIRVIAKRASGNQNDDSHHIEDVQYQLISRRGNGVADTINMVGPQGELIGSTYTTCDPEDPAWQRWYLRSREIDVNTDEGFATAHHAVVRIGNVPILYAPWFKFPIDDRRQTGLLFPRVGLSGKNGLSYEQPIYLNLAPNYDSTLYPRYMSDRGVVFGGEFRYLYHGGEGKLEGAWMPSDDLVRRRERDYANALPGSGDENIYNDPLQDKNRGFFRFRGHHDLNSTWQARADFSWISDSRYLEDNGGISNGTNGGYGYATSALTSTVGVYGRSQYWNAGAETITYTSADYTVDKSTLPYNSLPRLFFNYDRPVLDWLTVGLKSDLSRFDHSDKDGGSRLDLKPYLSVPLRGASWFIEPGLAYRYTAYRLEQGLADQLGGDRTPTRSTPITTVDAGLFFDRDTHWGDTPYLQTLEPRLYYLNVPYRNQNNLPLFDTGDMTYSWGQLFRDNRFSGADRQTDANQLTLALTSRSIRQTDGLEKFNISLGQILYFEDSNVVLNQNSQPIEKGKSAWIVDSNYMPTDRWTLGASYQYDAKNSRADLISFRSRYLIGNDGVVNLSYRYRRDLLKQADLSFLYPINPVWSVVGRYYYSFQDNKLLEAIGGVQWDSCCLAVRLLGRHYVRNLQGESDNQIQVEFVLKGLSSLGQNTDKTLRRGILGYYRDDLYLVPPSVAAPDLDDNDDTGSDPF
ncbi:LPS assembly protein LptD [Pseudoxanthomonas winnipegensis]|uniref:LPS-assembly protein LptD n=1 Tax=Pseudoxanthomonas winnipegensis TaxID=2480810 RepID=A0A4Q8LFY3_9GAMM|nr:LPS assembly protein LptD [Pseudoxanthomonas winnipegensis]PZP59880.1 MAG: LPS-assembly protein LptD [Pseudoxanthomonas spadix]TAA28124.1 LPS-assembly protein LptD [Pseudoxanthomonas winnipegensis]